MAIHPLPQFEADLKADEEAALAAARDASPTTVVVRYGVMRLIGEFPCRLDAKPGCGSRLVVQTHRGLEVGEVLTSTCPNSGCAKSVSRKDMLEYIEASGGRDYPFSTQGRVVRVATDDDLAHQARLDESRPGLVRDARDRAARLGLPMKLVEAEPILGGERLTFYFASEDRVDFRELAHDLGSAHRCRVELRQVGARDEARLTADYERCGQHCCCKQFLKVLKPVSMRSAKVQKATLDPLKISGRCGRLMCCLRYEDQTYEQLSSRLPRRRTRVRTPEGEGVVVDTQILTQLVLVALDGADRSAAFPVESLEPATGDGPPPVPSPEGPQARGRPESRRDRPRPPEARGERPAQAPPTPRPSSGPTPQHATDPDEPAPAPGGDDSARRGEPAPGTGSRDPNDRGPRRRRRRGPGTRSAPPASGSDGPDHPPQPPRMSFTPPIPPSSPTGSTPPLPPQTPPGSTPPSSPGHGRRRRRRHGPPPPPPGSAGPPPPG